VRAERGRTKKLTVAFHFFRAEHAAWNCDACRKQGLERRRRCGFLPEAERGPARLVWARGRVGTDECPRSAVTPESLALLEAYFAWKAWGVRRELSAREADAFGALEEEWRREVGDGS
jgi:hypothetical protein